MAFQSPSYGAISIGASATLILDSNPDRKGCVLYNNGTTTCYIGFDASVTSANGLPIIVGASFNNSGFEDLFKSSIYGVTASGSVDLRYWEWE